MQFINPEILYFLFLLVIPILIHLFQFQKFQKIAFTNVKLLKQIEQQTRKSAKLKKLLILLSRLLLFASLIIAFAQPYFSKDKINVKGETYIYLDNSLSMQAKGEKGELLQKAKSDLIESFNDKESSITIITNNKIYKDLQINQLKNELLKIDYYPIKKDLKTVLLEIKSLQNKRKNTLINTILISDFQNINSEFNSLNINNTSSFIFVQILPEKAENISIDSVWISEQNDETTKIKSKIRSHNIQINNLSISIYNNDNLLGKATVSLDKNKSEIIEFSVPNSNNIYGKISLNDNKLLFDNNLYFSLPKKEIRNVLAIGNSNSFLSKIYTPDEFNFTTSNINKLDYSLIPNQNLILLNSLESIPNSLINILKHYIEKEGNLVVIPSIESDITSYNKFLSSLQIGRIIKVNNSKKIITTINYNHPFFKNVFQKQINNFQYPIVNLNFESKLNQMSSILQFDDKSDFISEKKINNSKFYWISSPLDRDNSNFISSPLIVPVFYNFALQKFNSKNLYLTIGNKNELIIKSDSNKNDVLHIKNKNSDFIPLQTRTPNHVRIQTDINPIKGGVYQITYKNDTLQNVAYNYDRKESDLTYNPIDQLVKNIKNAKYFTSINNAITNLNDQHIKHNLWQLFIIFALLFLGIEIVLQKFLKS